MSIGVKRKMVSIIVPVYNAEKSLDRCIQSIVNNTYPDFELILIDDGSVDSSGRICDEWEKRDNRIKAFHQKNRGTAAARNYGIFEAVGDYIAFADNDDIIHPQFLESLLKALIDHNADIVMCELTRTEDDHVFCAKNVDTEAYILEKRNLLKDTYVENWTRNTVPWNKLYKRELFESVRFPEGKGYEDAYTTYRLLNKADIIIHINEALYLWTQNPDSYSSLKHNPTRLFFREEAIREQAEFYENKGMRDVADAAWAFYLKQLHFMDYQLRHDYEQNEETKQCEKKMYKLLKNGYKRYHGLCKKEDQERYFEWCYPLIAVVLKKLDLR